MTKSLESMTLDGASVNQPSDNVSTLVRFALVKTLYPALTMTVGVQVVHEATSEHEYSGIYYLDRPSMLLLHAASAVADVCANADVHDEDSLQQLMKTLRRQLNVVEEWPPHVRSRAIQLLEHCLAAAESDARRALADALAGHVKRTVDGPPEGGSERGHISVQTR
jgi:hypothetical protein